jgi:hypothetical protein
MTGKKTKVALCLSGEPRNSMFCFPYIYESFINLGPQYEVDVYIHSWRGFRALNLYNPKNFQIDNCIDEDKYFRNYVDTLLSQNQPPKLLLEYLEANRAYTTNNSSLKNTILMFTSIKKSFNLIKDSYDIYIRSRFDLFFEQPFTLTTNIIEDIQNKYYDISLPSKKIYDSELKAIGNLTDDQMAIGNYKSLKAYVNTISNFYSNIDHSNSLQPEKLLQSQLQQHNINISYISPPISLVRKHCIITNNPYNDLNYKSE